MSISSSIQSVRMALRARIHGRKIARFELGTFGKHPGWDDHIDDIGLATTAMLAAKQLLYINGIGKLIDTSAWENLSETERLPEFAHSFLWFGGATLLLGRIWASQDGKGRSRYPMVVCAEMDNSDTQRKISWLMPKLQTIEDQCRSLSDAEEIKRLFANTKWELQQDLLELTQDVQAHRPAEAIIDTAILPTLRDQVGDDGMCRTIYGIKTQLAGLKANASSNPEITVPSPGKSTLAQHLRLPALCEQPTESVLFWRRQIEAMIGSNVQMLLLCPQSQQWCDVIVGCPSPKELFCLRASSTAVPVFSDIPYNLSDEFRTEVLAELGLQGDQPSLA